MLSEDKRKNIEQKQKHSLFWRFTIYGFLKNCDLCQCSISREYSESVVSAPKFDTVWLSVRNGKSNFICVMQKKNPCFSVNILREHQQKKNFAGETDWRRILKWNHCVTLWFTCLRCTGKKKSECTIARATERFIVIIIEVMKNI